jgi:hypothetical protein
MLTRAGARGGTGAISSPMLGYRDDATCLYKTLERKSLLTCSACREAEAVGREWIGCVISLAIKTHLKREKLKNLPCAPACLCRLYIFLEYLTNSLAPHGPLTST